MYWCLFAFFSVNQPLLGVMVRRPLAAAPVINMKCFAKFFEALQIFFQAYEKYFSTKRKTFFNEVKIFFQ